MSRTRGKAGVFVKVDDVVRLRIWVQTRFCAQNWEQNSLR